MTYLYLFATFFKIGLFSIGGGFATLPFLFEIADNAVGIFSGGEYVDVWLSREMIANMLAVAQSLPGAVGANLSAYTGFRYAGIPGAYASAFGLITPSIIVIIFVARALDAFKESAVVKSIFSGFRPAATGLLSAAGLGAISISLWNAAAPVWYEYLRWKETLIFAVIFFVMNKFKRHLIIYIVAAGAVGVILKL